MLSVAFIADTLAARWVKSASVAAALSRIACAKADHTGICASVMPSCDCNVRMRWSTAASAEGESAGGAGGEAAGAGAAFGIAADCARPMDGTNRVANATQKEAN